MPVTGDVFITITVQPCQPNFFPQPVDISTRFGNFPVTLAHVSGYVVNWVMHYGCFNTIENRGFALQTACLNRTHGRQDIGPLISMVQQVLLE